MKIDKLVRYAAGLGLIGAMFFACTGELKFDPPDNPGPDAPVVVGPETAKEYFDQKVAPILQQENQCGCHVTQSAPLFVKDTANDTYNYLKADYPDGTLIGRSPAESSFYTKAQAAHYGAEWKGNQAAYVSDWITWEYDEYDQPAPAARDIFNQYVHTAIEMKCGCHNVAAPVFRGASPDATYDLLKANYPNGAVIRSTPAASTFYTVAYQQVHQGQQWSPDEATNISNWITEEYAEYSAGQ